MLRVFNTRGTALLAVLGAASLSFASSHREAPFVTEHPKVDATDFYMFNSYEAGRDAFVTVVANYIPLQDAYGGPNFFTFDPDAIYEIDFDNDGDGKPDITFTFDFENEYRKTALAIGPPGAQKNVTIPLIQAGTVSAVADPNLNVVERYSVQLKQKGKASKAVKNAATGETKFVKPVDNIGNKTIANYPSYAALHVYDIELPGGLTGRMFVGQRKESFVVNLGETFDLLNIANPVGSPSAEVNILDDKNITSIELELPKAFLLGGGESTVVGGYTTASMHKVRKLDKTPTVVKPAGESGEFVQVSRLGNPLVNEVVIGIDKKDLFNGSDPVDDAQFADFVTFPTFPAFVELLFGPTVVAPTLFPRTDLVAVFLTGVSGLNQIGANPKACEMMRLNTAIAAVPAAQQNAFGVLGGDTAGYPNGRRPGDDVVDITLRAAMGALLSVNDAPSGQLPFTDGAAIDATMFDSVFPYLKSPIPGSPGN